MLNIFNQLTTISPADTKLFVTSILLYAVYRYVMTNCVFTPLSSIIKIEEKRKVKFANRCFDLLHYATSEILGLFAVLTRPYAQALFWAKD